MEIKKTSITQAVGDVSLEEWSLNAFDEMQKLAVTAAEEALNIALKSNETNIFFPYMWDDAETETVKPLTVALKVDIGVLDEGVHYHFNLSDALYDVERNAYPMEDKYKDRLRRVAEELRMLATDIEDAVESEGKDYE